jgi:hypothetical protein
MLIFALLSWVIWVGVASDGFSGMHPAGWLVFVGVPVAAYIALLAVSPYCRRASKEVRRLLSANLMWAFLIGAWGYVWEWENVFSFDRYLGLLLLPVVGTWLGYLLLKWSRSASSATTIYLPGRDEEVTASPKAEPMRQEEAHAEPAKLLPDDQRPLNVSMRQNCVSCARETEHDAKGYCVVCGRNAPASAAYIKSQKIRIWSMPNWFRWIGWIGAIGLVALHFAYNRNEATQTLVSSLVQAIGLLVIYGIYRLFSSKK